MAKIYKRSDKIPIQISDIVFEISPLSLDEKSEIQDLLIRGKVKGDIKSMNKGHFLMFKYAIKGCKGIENADGSSYALRFDGDKHLEDECVEELLTMDIVEKVSLALLSCLEKIPKEFVDKDGKKLEGVEFVKDGTKEEKK